MGYAYQELRSSETHYAEAARIYRELGYRREFARATSALALSMGLRSPDALGQAFELSKQAVAIMRELDDPAVLAPAINVLGILYSTSGDYGNARTAYEESLKIGIDIGDRIRESLQYYNLGYVALHGGDYKPAEALFLKSMDFALELDQKPFVAEILFTLAGVIGMQGRSIPAARLMGAAECFLDNIGVLFQPGNQRDFERSKAEVREQMGERMFESAWAEGREMSLEQAIEYARGKTLT
jgi:tetratricopeptide (TPR) repeat protein